MILAVRNGAQRFLATGLIGAALPVALLAQGTSPGVVSKDIDFHRTRISAYPYGFYTPETKLAFGAGGIMTFYTGEAGVLRPSKFTASAYYSTKGQYNFSLGPQVYLASNRVLLGTHVSYGYFIDKFLGDWGGPAGHQARGLLVASLAAPA